MKLETLLNHCTMCHVYIDDVLTKKCLVQDKHPYEVINYIGFDGLERLVHQFYPCLNENGDSVLVISIK